MVFYKEQREICKEALNTYGIDKQLDIAIEEMAELTKAIIKHRRYATRETYENLCEETADVAIMIEQIFLSTRCDDVAKYAVEKINRLKQRLEREAEPPEFKLSKPVLKVTVTATGKTSKQDVIIKGVTKDA